MSVVRVTCVDAAQDLADGQVVLSLMLPQQSRKGSAVTSRATRGEMEVRLSARLAQRPCDAVMKRPFIFRGSPNLLAGSRNKCPASVQRTGAGAMLGGGACRLRPRGSVVHCCLARSAGSGEIQAGAKLPLFFTAVAKMAFHLECAAPPRILSTPTARRWASGHRSRQNIKAYDDKRVLVLGAYFMHLVDAEGRIQVQHVGTARDNNLYPMAEYSGRQGPDRRQLRRTHQGLDWLQQRESQSVNRDHRHSHGCRHRVHSMFVVVSNTPAVNRPQATAVTACDTSRLR